MPKRLSRKPHDIRTLFLRLEELMLADSGVDPFDEAFDLVARKLYDETHDEALLGLCGTAGATRLDPALHARCRELLAPFSLSSNGEALDALFETLIARTSKGQKGQFFTPRYVVAFCLALIEPKAEDEVLDPACGSGAFLGAALERGVKSVRGFDIDRRAARVARLLLAVRGGDPRSIDERDSLRALPKACADIILTNPPFAGEIVDGRLLAQYDLAQGRDRVERDVLFLEQCVNALRPGGTMAIILPHNKFAGAASRYIRQWLLEHAQVLGVFGLGRNTFLPHTHQKANVLVARRRTAPKNGAAERIFFAQSSRDGKTSRAQLRDDHDLNEIVKAYRSAERAAPEYGSLIDVARLQANLALAPERYPPTSVPETNELAATPRGGLLSDTAGFACAYARPHERGPFVVVDTSHACEGFISAGALRVVDRLQSGKKCLQAGDVVLSRLRPYLRQIAYVDAALVERFSGSQLCCSTEFYVLRPAQSESIAFLVPFLLSRAAQAKLIASQEGGHHPRVPAATIASINLPHSLRERRRSFSREFEAIIEALRVAERAREELISRSEPLL